MYIGIKGIGKKTLIIMYCVKEKKMYMVKKALNTMYTGEKRLSKKNANYYVCEGKETISINYYVYRAKKRQSKKSAA